MPRLPNLNVTTGFQDPFGTFIPTKKEVRTQAGSESKRKQYDEFGFLPPHALTVERSRWTAQAAVQKNSNRCYTRIMTYTWDSFPSWRKLNNELYDRCANKLYERLSNANALLPVIFAERQKTVDMVTKNAVALYRFWKKFRSGSYIKNLFKVYNGSNSRKSQRALRRISGKWLEYRYGWLPLMMEVNTLLNKPLGLPRMKVAAGSNGFINHFDQPNSTYKEEGQVNISWLMGCIAFAKNAFTKTLQQYGLSSPAVVVWELIPFSFVADWFLGVGNYLEALGSTSGLDIRHAYQTATLNATISSTLTPAVDLLTVGRGVYSGRLIQRTLGLPRIPNPLIPSNGLNLTRATDAIALIVQTFRSLK